MSCPSACILGEDLTFTTQAISSTGALVDATGDVSYSVYEDETSTAILTGTMAKLASKTGFYSEQISCTSANGFEQFKSYTVRITATVSTIAVAKSYSLLCVGPEDTPSATTGALTTTALYKSYAGITHTDDDTLIGYLISRATSAIEAYCGRVLRTATYRERYDGPGETELLLNQYPVTAITLLTDEVQDGIGITNISSDAYSAYVTITSTTMTLTVAGGTPDDLTLADYTISELATAIDDLGNGWGTAAVTTAIGYWESSELLIADGLQCLNQYCYGEIPYDPKDDFKIIGQTASPFMGNYGGLYCISGFVPGHQNVVVKYTAGYATTPADLEQICIDLVNVYYRTRSHSANVKSERLGDHSIAMVDDKGLPNSIKLRLTPWAKIRI